MPLHGLSHRSKQKQRNASFGQDSSLLLVGLLYLLWCGVSADAENPGSQWKDKTNRGSQRDNSLDVRLSEPPGIRSLREV